MSPFRSAMTATLLWILCGGAPLAAPAAAAQETAIRIGDAVGAVQAALHTTIEPVPQTGAQGPTQILRLPTRGLWVFFKASNQSYTVRFDAPFNGTVSGIGIGTSRDDLVAKLGQPNKVITTFALPGIRTRPYLYNLASGTYYKRAQIDDALFWLNAAGLRGKFDAKICTDTSAQSAIAELSQKMPPDLYRQQWQDPVRIKKIVDRVIDWDTKTAADYDHRWISLHGLKAVNSGLGISIAPGPLTLPQAQWHDIAEKNRQSYRADMYRYAAGDRQQAI
jgi:hypothetical protein